MLIPEGIPGLSPTGAGVATRAGQPEKAPVRAVSKYFGRLNTACVQEEACARSHYRRFVNRIAQIIALPLSDLKKRRAMQLEIFLFLHRIPAGGVGTEAITMINVE